HTRFSRDWSSDVCSSDLSRALASADRGEIGAATCFAAGLLPVIRADAVDLTAAVLLVSILLARPSRWWLVLLALIPLTAMEAFQIGRASCREGGVNEADG